MAEGLRVAVVGATGLVGREMVAALAERAFPVAELVPMASARSAGSDVAFAGRPHKVELARREALVGFDLVLMSAGSAASAELAPAAAAAGALVIDNSAQWRMAADVPLVVPEVNAAELTPVGRGHIVANPNCAAIQMAVALAPLHREAELQRAVVSTYQAVSGRGQRGIDELGQQVAALYNHRDIEVAAFAKRIAFNCLPHIDTFRADGSTEEEAKIAAETVKILAAPELGLCVTCVRVPVFNGHAVSIAAQFVRPLSAQRARAVLAQAPGLAVDDDPRANAYPTPVEVSGQDAVYVGRIRADLSVAHGLALWVAADNLRKGAATNAVQIAEAWLRAGGPR